MTSSTDDRGTSNLLMAGVSQIINFYWTQTHATGGVRRLIGLFISLCGTLLSAAARADTLKDFLYQGDQP